MLNPLYEAVAWLLLHIHDGVAHVITSSGWAWALSIVFLTMAMRLLLYPVFVKQIRSQRVMQAMQPKIKELQAKYKNDRAKLNEEMQKVWKEQGVNPLAGCLPLLLQIPIFISLFHTLNKLKANGSGFPGFPSSAVHSAAFAKIFGVPISAAFNSSASTLHELGATQSSTRILCAVMVALMSATTFLTQRQMMSFTAANGQNTQMAQQQKILLYILPLVFLFTGTRFPIGVLIYWLTTNVWSLGQQQLVIRHMEAADLAIAAAAAGAVQAGPPPGVKPRRAPGIAASGTAATAAGSPSASPSTPAPAGPSAGSPGPSKPRPGSTSNRPSSQRRRRKRR